MHEVKGLFFDVRGTVFDWKNTAREKFRNWPMKRAKQ